MRIQRDGATLAVPTPTGPESTTFASADEAGARAAFIEEAISWIGTPFRDCADVKGRSGAVDCAMLLTRCAVDTGLVPAFDPRPYPPRWHLHRDEERFTSWIEHRLGGREVPSPRPGDIVVWRFGRTFSHGAVCVGAGEVVHAWSAAGCVLASRMDEPMLASIGLGVACVARPVRFFDLWSVRAMGIRSALSIETPATGYSFK